MPRPTKMTPDILNKLEYAFSIGCSDLEACLHANIGKSTLYDYQNAHPEFSERKALLKDKLILQSRNIIASKLKEKDIDTAKWYLERKKKSEFSTRIEGEKESTNIKIDITELVESTNESIDKLIDVTPDKKKESIMDII